MANRNEVTVECATCLCVCKERKPLRHLAERLPNGELRYWCRRAKEWRETASARQLPATQPNPGSEPTETP